MPSLRVDRELGAAYLALSDRAVARTVEVAGGVLVDLDDDGLAVGVELLNFATRQQIATAIGGLEPDRIPEDYPARRPVPRLHDGLPDGRERR